MKYEGIYCFIFIMVGRVFLVGFISYCLFLVSGVYLCGCEYSIC